MKNDKEILYDEENIIYKSNHPLSDSDSKLFDFNQLSKEKTIVLSITCISIGMFTGLLGPTFPFLAQNMSTDLSSIIWIITVKAIGFFIGTYLSSYLYIWFNVCCLLGLSCLSISFSVCSLPFITDLTTFYLTSLILGTGLGLSYNGLDALYNRLWIQSSASSIRWLHLLVALGAILSTLMLFPSMNSNENNILLTTNNAQSPRLHRAILNNTTLLSNLSTVQLTTKSIFVTSELLYTKSSLEIEQLTTKSICMKFYCCYHQNNKNHTFICQEKSENQSNDCKNILSSCQNLATNICNINKNSIQCRIDQICMDNIKPTCSIELIDAIINVNTSTITNITAITTKTTFISNQTTTIPIIPIRRTKPSMAESDNDDLSQNFFYLKIHSFFHTITLIHIIYLFIGLLFFFLGIFYSILAMYGEGLNSSLIINLNPLSLLFIESHRIVNNSNIHISLLYEKLSLKFIFLIILFYLILSAIENSCFYLTYLYGRKFHLSEIKCLLFQFCYLFGRLIDILINYTWFLLNKYMKKQSDLISIKFLIFVRLIILFLICIINLFQQIHYFVFFSTGILITSLPSLILYWIEHELSINERFLRIILFTVIISEMFFPIIFFYKIEYFLRFYILIALCLLIILFINIIYLSQKWQRNKLYRLLPTSIEMESQENFDYEKPKNSKLH